MKYQDVLKRFVSEQAQLLQEKQMKQQLQEQMLAAKAQALSSFIPGQQQSPQEEYSETEHNPFEEGQEYKAGGIHIDPSKKGTFKAQATRMGMSVQEAASHILNNKEDYTPTMVKKANFAKNFAKEEGGSINNPGFNALPEYVQEKILNNMAYGGESEMEEYENGGYTVRKTSERKGKTHVVTGPDGTKKYFGDPNMGERSKSKHGKDAFYARHADNLKNNPYFRAYAKATWEDGGEMYGDPPKKNPYRTQVRASNNLNLANGNTNFNSSSMFIDDYDDGTPSDTSYMYVTPTENVFFSTAVNPETKQKFGQRQSNDKFSQLTPEERKYYQAKIMQELQRKESGGMFTGDYEYEDGGEKNKKKAVTVEKNLSRTTETDKNSNQTRTTGLNATLDFKTKYGLTAGFDANLNNDRRDVLNITNQRLSFDNNIGKTDLGFKIENQSDENGNFDRANSDVSAYLRRRKLGLDASNHMEKNEEGLYTFSPTVGLTYGSADEEGKNFRVQGEFAKDENDKWKVVPTIDAGYKSGPLTLTSQQRYQQNSEGRYDSDLKGGLEYDNGSFNAGLTGNYSKENYLENPSNKFGVGANLGYTGDKFGFGARANYDQNNRTLTDYDEEGNPINNIEKTSKFTGSANANANIPLSDAMMLKLAASNNFKEGDLVDPRLTVGLNYKPHGSRASVGVSNEFREGSLNNPSVNFKYTFQEGGDMIRRADGSYSKRGLWDNIRDNAGSGKKPTREMLEQERKIRREFATGGSFNNAGFNALPEAVQDKIIAAMMYGGNIDNNNWD